MSITDELREYARGYKLTLNRSYQTLMEIADRIDAKHDAALNRKFIDAVLYGTEFVTMPASEMAERYIELPKDSDGEYIHEHDKVDWRDHAGMWHENATVVAVCNDGCCVMDDIVFHVHKSDIRHHHEPTVEDVLHELVTDWDDSYDAEGREDVLKEYAAKLRLAGDAE